ncbi:MAG: type I-C CRISPR-associated protein Cas8c/Csd1 [Candidatus Paceibacteria bacterium]
MILTALYNYYERLIRDPDITLPRLGYSYENISFALVLSKQGTLVDVMDLRDTSGKKPQPLYMVVPQSEKRSSGIKPFFLWDKTSYVLGVSSSNKIHLELHKAFVSLQEDKLRGTEDTGLKAFLKFLKSWKPENFWSTSLFSNEMLDTNIIFRIDGEKRYLHEREEVYNLLSRQFEEGPSQKEVCLVTGSKEPIARLHSSIKGVKGAQSSGASIVSFNLNASTSYGKTQGENAPVSQKSAFKYATALNYLLRNSEYNRQCLQIGDATTVFWAIADSYKTANETELTFSQLLDPKPDDLSETDRLRISLTELSQGRAVPDLDSHFDHNTQLFILGLAPNSSRLSIRFWETGSLAIFANRLSQHYQDLLIHPIPWESPPAIWYLLLKTTVPHPPNEKPQSKNIPHQLAGELIRSVLSGQRYPRSLLITIIMRIRADGNINGIRAALCKAVIARDQRLNDSKNPKEVPVTASIRDKYYGAASATPASIFPVLMRNSQHHLGRLHKDKPGAAIKFEKEIGEIMEGLAPTFPKNLNIESQGRFAIGYYHQRQSYFKKTDSDNK